LATRAAIAGLFKPAGRVADLYAAFGTGHFNRFVFHHTILRYTFEFTSSASFSYLSIPATKRLLLIEWLEKKVVF
jgi:hypothetical protein